MIYGTHDKDGNVIIRFNSQVEKLGVGPYGLHLLPCDMCGAVHQVAELCVSFVCNPCARVAGDYKELGENGKSAYRQLRQSHPEQDPERIVEYLNDGDGGATFSQSVCRHEWVNTGTAYGGDDERYAGEGVCYCAHCGLNGDA